MAGCRLSVPELLSLRNRSPLYGWKPYTISRLITTRGANRNCRKYRSLMFIRNSEKGKWSAVRARGRSKKKRISGNASRKNRRLFREERIAKRRKGGCLMEKVIQIEGMSCRHCVGHVEAALGQVAGCGRFVDLSQKSHRRVGRNGAG